MPWLPFFADESDAGTLLRWLNADPEIAFIVPDGPHRWKAVASVSHPPTRTSGLWHHPSGSLPLLKPSAPDERIRDPWRGWQELRAGADPTIPYFGPGDPAVVWLTLDARPHPSRITAGADRTALNAKLAIGRDLLWLSDFQWIGNRYGPAPAPVQRWWKRLRVEIARSATKLVAACTAFWAFPSALAAMQVGLDYYANGFDLTDALTAAADQ